MCVEQNKHDRWHEAIVLIRKVIDEEVDYKVKMEIQSKETSDGLAKWIAEHGNKTEYCSQCGKKKD